MVLHAMPFLAVACLSEPGPCSRVGKAEVPFDSLLLAWGHCAGCAGAHISRAADLGASRTALAPFAILASNISHVLESVMLRAPEACMSDGVARLCHWWAAATGNDAAVASSIL